MFFWTACIKKTKKISNASRSQPIFRAKNLWQVAINLEKNSQQQSLIRRTTQQNRKYNHATKVEFSASANMSSKKSHIVKAFF